MMEQRLPFPVTVRRWAEMSGRDRRVCGFAEDDRPLPPSHASQIGLLVAEDAARVASWAFASIPPGWPDRPDARFEHEDVLNVYDCWNDAARRAEVRRWLFGRGIPFGRVVYLLYERNSVVQTTWKMVVRYWDAFAWSVGYAMFAVDHTLGWACCFHHEDMFVFGSRDRRGPDRRVEGRRGRAGGFDGPGQERGGGALRGGGKSGIGEGAEAGGFEG